MKTRAGNTVTFSISVDKETQRILKKEAKRLFEGNVSALVAALAREAQRNAALDSYLRGVEIDPKEYREFLAELEGASAPKKRRRAA
jgi:hypothetical protein